MSIRWSDLQVPTDPRPRSSSLSLPRSRSPSVSLPRPRPRSSSVSKTRLTVPQHPSASLSVPRSRSPSPNTFGRHRSRQDTKDVDHVAKLFAKTVGDCTYLAPCELRNVLASKDSYPFCIRLLEVDMLEIPNEEEDVSVRGFNLCNFSYNIYDPNVHSKSFCPPIIYYFPMVLVVP